MGFSAQIRVAIQLFLGVITAGMLLFSCQSMGFTHQGRMSTQNEPIELLQGGPHQGLWQGPHLELNYSYEREHGLLSLNGEARLAQSLNTGFRTFDYFYLKVNFLDAEGKVLDSAGIYTAGYREDIRSMPFKRRVEIPADGTAMTFSYNGRVSEGMGGSLLNRRGMGDGTYWDFWLHP